MHDLTDADLAQLADNGIRHAFDLRSNKERHAFPNRLNGQTGIEYWSFDQDHLQGDISRMLVSSATSTKRCREMMLTVYRELPVKFREAYTGLFQRLAEGDLPLVFNCTAGKDRTGVAAALVLSALGVPRDIIYEDYLLTNQFFERSCAVLLHCRYQDLFENISRDIWEPLMRVDHEYLDATFAHINAAHGSVENYLSDELGVTAAVLAQLRANMAGPSKSVSEDALIVQQPQPLKRDSRLPTTWANSLEVRKSSLRLIRRG